MAEEDVLVGKYRRLNVIQTGQNSEVWEVCEVGSTQRYTMKLLLPERIDEPGQRQLLRHEATVGLSLKHPKIIRFHSFHNDRKMPYILMELFPSSNLKLRLMRGQFDEFIKPRLRSILTHVIDSIEHVHSKNWVHRDIKPDNVLVNNLGDVRLIDFALAVRIAGGFARWFGRKQKTAAGTRSYMSPEQIRGLPLDGRADIYSLGVMLYEIVAGRMPFVAQSGGDLLRKHLQERPPPIPSTRNATPAFVALIGRMMGKKPEERPANLQEVRQMLRGMKIFTDEEDVVETGISS